MIVCRDCGNAAPSQDDFCGSCGALLAWAGEAVERTAEPAGSTAEGVSRHPAVEAVRPMPEPVAEESSFTGPYCWSCGAGNPEGRTYCRSCGGLLHGQAVAATRVPWWRRIFRRRSGYSAGERPGGFRRRDTSGSAAATDGRKRRRFRRPTMTTLRRFTPLVVLAGVAGLSLSPARQWAVDEFSQLTGKAKSELSRHYVPDTPTGASGSAADPDHAARLAVDGVSDTYWSVSTPKDGIGTVLTVTFAGPVDLDRVGLLSGVAGDRFRSEPRLHRLWIAGGTQAPTELAFDDTPDFQDRAIRLHGVTSVTITVEDAYPGQQGHSLAVRELQFFTLKHGS